MHDPKSGDARYTLDPDGRLLTEGLPSDWERRYHYEGGLLTRFEDLRNGKHARLTDLSYDADGQLKTKVEGSDEFTYSHDPAGQLVAVTNHDETVLQATYDPVGNRTSIRRDGVETRLTYDAADQLLSAVTGTERVDYRYDTSGRLVEQSDAATRRTTSYNAFGRPDTVTFTDGKVTQTRQHTYDGDNLLAVLTSTTKQEDADAPRTRTMRYRWSRTDPVAQILQQREDPGAGRNATCPNNDDGPDPDGEYRADANFVYGHGRVFADSPCGSGTFARDAFGSAIQTGDTWRWAQSSEYDVFGVPKPNDAEGSGTGQPPLDPRFGYRGELASGGTIYLRARSYDATVGRFTARDPLATEAGQTDVVSPYAYANNSPLNFADPRGEFPMPDDVLNIIAGLVPSLAAGQPCPEVENTPNPRRPKCFQGIQLMTRGGYDGKEWALNGAQAPLSEMWYARPSQGEKAAQAFAINELSERRDGAFWAFWDMFDYGLNINVDWEVGPKSGGFQQRSDGIWIMPTNTFRLDLVTDEKDIYEVKRWDNGKGRDIVTKELAEYHTLEKEWNIVWEDSIELRDWADGFEVSYSDGFLGLFNRKETDVLVWGTSDAGHLYFDEAELADEGARAKMKAKTGSGRNKGGYWRVPRRR
ncbi:RHS repeat-associated core domain-containing protein [Micromonospora sp. DT47]|uniref:RHS repeat protein n=1 Tax=Micromonospora sp. DT47 TaxID=3393431 RepID=UPI003CEFDCE6